MCLITQTPNLQREGNEDFGSRFTSPDEHQSPTQPSDPSPTSALAVAWAMSVSKTGSGLVRREANPERERSCDAGNGAVENSLLQAMLVQKELEISQLKSSCSKAANAIRTLKSGTEELLASKDRIIAKLQYSALELEPDALAHEDDSMLPLIPAKQREQSPDPMPRRPASVELGGISQFEARSRQNRASPDLERGSDSHNWSGPMLGRLQEKEKESAIRALEGTSPFGPPDRKKSQSLGREEFGRFQDAHDTFDKASLFESKFSL